MLVRQAYASPVQVPNRKAGPSFCWFYGAQGVCSPVLGLMKALSLRAQLATASAIILLAAQAVFAQVPLAGSGTGINVAFVKLFGPVSAFTAKVETQVIDPYKQVLV